MTNQDLMNGLRRRDNRAFYLLYQTVEPLVYEFCNQYAHDHHVAQDLTQSTFIRFLLSIDDFRGECSLKTWVIRIAENVCKNFVYNNKLKKNQYVTFSKMEYIYEEIEDVYSDDPLEKLIRKENQENIIEARQKLTALQRIAFELKTIHYMTYIQIAKYMNKTVDAVKKLVERAKINIINHIEKKNKIARHLC